MKFPIILMLTTLISKTISQIVFTFTAQPFGNQCVNNQISIFGLNMFVKGSVNGVQFSLPMEELGLPVINMDWFVNGNPANQLVVLQNFNVDGSMTIGNRWIYQLKDNQPNIGAGIITLGPCQPQARVTASFSTTSFIVGVGFPSLNLPAASGVPIVINNFAPQNNNAVITTTTLPVITTTTLPVITTTTSFLRSTSPSSIIFTITSTRFNKQCVNNKLSVFGLNMFIKGSVNGIPFNLPMAEIGLPVINMNWFVNGNPANLLTVLQTFNIDGSVTNGNMWTFQLKNDQPTIGAGTITLGPCTQANLGTMIITASFSSTSFIVGVGVPGLRIPPASGVPMIMNNLTI